MNINFNFIRKFKKCILFIIFSLFCFLFFNINNASALVVEDSVVNVNISDYTFDDIWNKGSIDDLISLNVNQYVSNLRNDLRNVAITNTSSLDFEDFTDNYYYAIVASYNTNSSPNRVIMNLYYLSKTNNEPFSFNFNFYSNSAYSDLNSLNSSTTRIYAIIKPNVQINSLGKGAVQQFSDGTSYNILTNNNYNLEFEFRKGSNGTTYSTFTYSNNEFNVNFGRSLGLNHWSVPNAYYIDSNVSNDLYFNPINYFVNQNSTYFFETMNLINSDNVSSSYSFNDLLYLDYSGTIYDVPNIKDLGNNSYAINLNHIENIVASLDTNFTGFNVMCPNDRDFVNGVCSIYNTDFPNFDANFTNFYNQLIYIFGSSNLSISSGKYYILTFRLYTSYYLEPDVMLFTLVGNENIYSVNDIYKVVVNDYGLYKDYQFVFDLPTGVNGKISSITLKFNELIDFTNNLDINYSFGAFKTLKLSQFDTMPTDVIIDNDYSVNNIDSISNVNNSSFFSNFTLNDYGLSSIILLPLNYFRNLPNMSCSSINLPIPKIGNFTLPCISSFMNNNFGVFWSLFKIVVNGLICYRILVNLFSTIKNIYKPDNDSIEVVDL